MKQDVVVIGAGAVGLSIARRLARGGAAVIVVDGRGPAGGASFGNAGLITPSHLVPLAAPGMVALGLKYLLNPNGPFRLTPRFDPALWGWLWRFARHCSEANVQRGLPVLKELLLRSRSLVEAEVAELGGFAFESKGLVMLAETANGRTELAHEAELSLKHGVPAEVCEGSRLAALDPQLGHLSGGVFFPQDAHLEPAAYTQALAADLEGHGGRVLHAHVRSLHRQGDGFVIETDRGEVRATTCVMAAGAWSSQLLRPLGHRLPLEAGRGCSLTYEKHPCDLRLPLILHEARVAVTPMAGHLRLAGTMELSGLDERISDGRLRALANAFSRVLPRATLPPFEAATTWAGLRPCSPDGLPYLGFVQPGLLVATGHAMLGISLAAVTGELGAQMLQHGNADLDLSALDPHRFE
jgi:D-amino-acid dehydrogenase